MSDTTPVLDSQGNQIVIWSIVVAENDLCRASFEGVAIATNSDISGNGRTVAVFYHREVEARHLGYTHLVVADWDERYKAYLEADDLSFLLDGDLLRSCPRVIFFRPEELTVREFWSLQTLADRTFSRDDYHMLFDLPAGISMESSEYECFMVGCNSRASKIALLNFYGSIFPMHVCRDCFTRVNGKICDCFPKFKVPTVVARGGSLVFRRKNC
jgi:hypothetical protein